MKTFLAAIAGFALIGAIGATQVSAQSVRITKGNKSVQINTRGDRDNNFREAKRVEKHQPKGHYITVEERVWVPGGYVIEHRDVWVEGHYDIIKEARRDRHGCIYYVSVKKWHPGHYECREVKVYKPGYYKTVCKQVWVEAKHGGGHGHGHKGHGHR